VPTGLDSLFLQACLPSGRAGRDAFMQWEALGGGSPEELRARAGHWRRLLPALYAAGKHNGTPFDPSFASVLRAAYVHEGLRTDAMRHAGGEILRTLADRGANVMVVGGVALAELVYDDPPLRHCHDLDLLVSPAALDTVVEALGLPLTGLRAGTAHLSHPAGMPIAVHTRPYPDEYYGPQDAYLDRPAQPVLAGVPIRVPNPVDMMVHVCTRPAWSSDRDVVWPLDAWFLFRRYPDTEWTELTKRAVEAHVALTLMVRLRWLRDELMAPVPEAVLNALAHAANLETLAGEVLLHQARRDLGSRALLRNAARRSRLQLLARLLFPSQSYLRLRQGDGYSARRSWLLARRTARHVRTRRASSGAQ
jgi:Uncharacterised nucleotidyltransferase